MPILPIGGAVNIESIWNVLIPFPPLDGAVYKASIWNVLIPFPPLSGAVNMESIWNVLIPISTIRWRCVYSKFMARRTNQKYLAKEMLRIPDFIWDMLIPLPLLDGAVYIESIQAVLILVPPLDGAVYIESIQAVLIFVPPLDGAVYIASLWPIRNAIQQRC